MLRYLCCPHNSDYNNRMSVTEVNLKQKAKKTSKKWKSRSSLRSGYNDH